MRTAISACRCLVPAVVLVAGLLTACTSDGAPPRAPRSPAHTRPSAPSSARSQPRTAVHGRLLTIAIPGRTSGFTARDAYLYLPPAALQRRPARLPLLELLHGTPGSPQDWATRGGVVQELNALAASSGGAAPITVIPDINGSRQGDSECIRAGNADIEEYLTSDVPDWVAAHYPLSAKRAWSVGGISEGGTCALMLALRHPGLFGAFGDLSGLARPTVGETDDPAATIRKLFGGSRTAYDRHDPMWLLRHHRFPTLDGWFSYGAKEVAVGAAVRTVASLARRAGIDAPVVVLSGRHSWPTWTAAMQRFLPWLWTQVGR